MSNKSDFVLIPKGTTAQRPNPAQTGMLRYNTTVPQYELYDGNAWVELGEQPPQFVSVSPNTLASDPTEVASTQNLVISGGNFKSGATVSLIHGGGTINASSVSVDSSSQITATFDTNTINSSHVTVANVLNADPYNLKIQNPSGLREIASDAVFVDSQPNWTLTNGTTLRTVMAHARTGLSIPITTATDPDGDAITYSATSLPTGLSINSSSGVITGDLANVTADTTNTFSVVANSTTESFSSAAQKSTTRSVNIVRKFGLSDSLLFDGSSYLSRTFGSGSTTTWTFSAWIKRSSLNTNQNIFTPSTPSAQSESQFHFRSNNDLRIYDNGGLGLNSATDMLFRDTSSFYHIVVVFDITNSVPADRVKHYVNGVLQSDNNAGYGTNTPTNNYNPIYNRNITHYIGTYGHSTSSNQLNAYMAEVNFIDGQALTHTSFGETLNGVWIPKVYNPGNDALTDYGTNGFHLTFAPSTISGTTVQDVSGRLNHWTATGFQG